MSTYQVITSYCCDQQGSGFEPVLIEKAQECSTTKETHGALTICSCRCSGGMTNGAVANLPCALSTRCAGSQGNECQEPRWCADACQCPANGEVHTEYLPAAVDGQMHSPTCMWRTWHKTFLLHIIVFLCLVQVPALTKANKKKRFAYARIFVQTGRVPTGRRALRCIQSVVIQVNNVPCHPNQCPFLWSCLALHVINHCICTFHSSSCGCHVIAFAHSIHPVVDATSLHLHNPFIQLCMPFVDDGMSFPLREFIHHDEKLFVADVSAKSVYVGSEADINRYMRQSAALVPSVSWSPAFTMRLGQVHCFL